MKTSASEEKKELGNWNSFLGERAIIESTFYASKDGYKPFLDLQVNMLESVENHTVETMLSFGDGRNRSDSKYIPYLEFLDSEPLRSIGEVMFEPSEVREYAKQKIIKNEYYLTKVAANKENIKEGQYLLVLECRKNGLSVRMTSAISIVLRSTDHENDNTYWKSKGFGTEEIDEMFDVIERHSSKLLDKEVPQSSEAQKSPPVFKRYVVSLLECNGDTQVLEVRNLGTIYKDIEMIKRSLEREYLLMPSNYVSAVIVDTYTNEVARWSK